jgi:hypothetical protein
MKLVVPCATAGFDFVVNMAAVTLTWLSALWLADHGHGRAAVYVGIVCGSKFVESFARPVIRLQKELIQRQRAQMVSIARSDIDLLGDLLDVFDRNGIDVPGLERARELFEQSHKRVEAREALTKRGAA